MEVSATRVARPQFATELIFLIGDATFSVSGSGVRGWAVDLGEAVGAPLRYASIEEVMFAIINFSVARETSV